MEDVELKKLRLIIESCQGQHHFLSTLVTQNSTEWMRRENSHWKFAEKKKIKDWVSEERIQVSTFGKKTSLKVKMIPDYQITEPSGGFNAGSELILFLIKTPHGVQSFRLLAWQESIKPVVMEIDEFEWRNFSLLGVSWHSRTIRISTQGTESRGKMSCLSKQTETEILQLEVKSLFMED